MGELILHHFLASPFSEKVRSVLGYKQLAWKSVIVPGIMPKPDVVTLTGGYRRTPFLQIGADIYCDTALICDVLEELRPTPTLYPAEGHTLARVLAQWADTTLFWAAVTYNRGPKGAGSKFGGALTELPAAIFEDRKAMGFDVEWRQPADAATAYRSYVARLSNLLQNQPYMLGHTPCIADFCAYHPLWLVHMRAPAAEDILQHMPAVRLAGPHAGDRPCKHAEFRRIAGDRGRPQVPIRWWSGRDLCVTAFSTTSTISPWAAESPSRPKASGWSRPPESCSPRRARTTACAAPIRAPAQCTCIFRALAIF